MQSFCSEQKGFDLGRRGQAYRYICPPEFEPVFRAGYDKGREIYEYVSRVASLQNQLHHIEGKINKKEKQLYAANLSDVQRSKIRSDLRELDLRYREVSRELKYMEDHSPEFIE